MKIRSITCFMNPGWPLDEARLYRVADFITQAKTAFSDSGYEVQTARLATPPFPDLLPGAREAALLEFAVALETTASRLGFKYVSLGPASPGLLESYAMIPPVLAATENTFLSGRMTEPDGGISLPAVRACAEVIVRAAGLSADGFANLRFAALANVPPGMPFFPAAYHGSNGVARGSASGVTFALALEAADLAVEAVTRAASLSEARRWLIEAVEGHAQSLEQTAEELAQRLGLEFAGLDFTLAPFPLEERSFGTAIERLGVPSIGLHGSLAAAAFLIDAMDRAEFRRAGFNGLFLPVLEDAALARSAAEGALTVKDLLLYSTVCGTGLDVLPLPGDVSVEAVYPLLLDLAALAQRLDKPLTARLMPIPGKRAGEPTGFDFAYFANSRALPLQAEPLQGKLAGDETFQLQKRPPGTFG